MTTVGRPLTSLALKYKPCARASPAPSAGRLPRPDAAPSIAGTTLAPSTSSARDGACDRGLKSCRLRHLTDSHAMRA